MKMDMLRFIAAAIIAVSAAYYLVPPCQCDCAAINTECGQPGTFSSLREWENTLEKEPTDAERAALSNVIDGES